MSGEDLIWALCVDTLEHLEGVDVHPEQTVECEVPGYLDVWIDGRMAVLHKVTEGWSLAGEVFPDLQAALDKIHDRTERARD